MSLDNRNTSAQYKRAEQLKRWEESEMNKKLSGVPKSPSSRRIKFSSGCIFLAACVAGDKEEVEWLLKNGADIDTANVDGLTALHQACIDDNLDMVEFLVQKGADVNRKDNEGWTPLHATASCGFLSIARYLIENGADLASINSDGELAVDLANSDAMEDLIQHHLDEQGIDCEEARQAEERIMLSDATKWLRTDSPDCDKAHPKTGATAIHVAAAKGYIGVLKLLLEGRGDIDRQDVDGWTPLHAAAYWGQKEATQMLLNASADIDVQNYSGQLAIDIAQDDIVPLLKDARKNGKRTKRRPPSHGNRITDNFENSTETPTKVIRVEVKPIDSNKEKEAGGSVAVDYGDDDVDDGGENVAEALPESPPVAGDQEEEEEADEKDEEEDEETMDDTVDEALEEEEEVEEEEVEEEEEEEEEAGEEEEEQQEHVSAQENRPGEDVTDSSIGSVPCQQVLPLPAQINQTKDAESDEEEEEEEEENGSVSSEPYSSSNPSADSSMTESETDELLPRPVPIISRPTPVPLTTQIVAPKPRVTEPPVPSNNAAPAVANNPAAPPTAPWRRARAVPTPVPRQFYEEAQQPPADDVVDYANLVFTSKRNLVSEKENKPTEPDVILRRTQSFESDEKFYQRYAELRARIQANSCPHTILPSTPINTKTSTASNNNNNSSNNNNNNNNNSTTNNSSGTTTTPASNISSYLVQRSASLKDHRTLRKTTSNLVLGSTTTSPSSATGPASGATTNLVPPAATGTGAANNTTGSTTGSSGAVSPPTSPSGTPTTTPTAGQIRRSFVPPTRDEESETQRKAHAKRVRETRRSTQGVTLDEIKSAEQLVKKKNATGSGNENDTMAPATATATTTTTTPSSPSSLSSTASPSFTNDRVPAVGSTGDQQQQQGSNHVTEGSAAQDAAGGGVGGGSTKVEEIAVSASFTLAAPGSSLDDGGDGGGGGGGGGGHRRHRRSVAGMDEEEDDSKVTVSYTISAPVRQSSPSPRAVAAAAAAVSNSKESADPLDGTGAGDVPAVTATFHVPATASEPMVATSATIRTSSGAAGGVVSNSDSNTTTTNTSNSNNNNTSASFNTNHNTAATTTTYTKRSLFDIDNANSLTLAEKLRHEANKYAIAAVADGDLDSHLVARVPGSNSGTTNSGGGDESNSTSTNAPADNSAASAGAAVPPSPTLRKADPATTTTTGVTAERRPSWRLKVDGGSKFKLEDASTPNAATQSSSVASSGSVYEPSGPANQAPEHGLTTTKLTSSSALAQRRAQQQNGDSSTATTGTTSSNVASSRPLSAPASGLAAGEQYNRVPGSAATAAGEQQTVAAATDPNSPLHHLRRPPKSAGEENKENDKENDSRSTAQATQAVIQRRRRQKRRSTGVVSVGMEDLDPDRQDSPVDGDEKETGSERGRSRVGSTASELDTANQPQDSTRENGGDCIDYKALYEQEKADNDKLKMALRKKDEEVVTLKAALDRFTTATTKNNSLSELEKRERRAMERKMSEMEEELKLLQKYKTENERLRAENRALTRVVSKLTTSAQNQIHASKQ
ncbi:protein phosphatase 1 regulatory subunit 12A isoform X9 [Anopheles merus]|uniref:protein phosphatase 1 regulatory subunit 12A isoform X9 n=1 Tax=Anopheles merus TaxID=30066 RepID=UPI001BE3E871|nr:protein phosphatase 1 regulatory subunit 12A isoform X9 [Anopheles merus]